MTENKTGEPAFPCIGIDINGHADKNYGMTLRDYFAGQAMQGSLSSETAACHYVSKGSQSYAEKLAVVAYELADAMIKEREE